MAKRFTDTDKWKRPWFRGLPNELKVVWFYLLDQCDHAGVWCADFGLLEFQTGAHFDAHAFEASFEGKIKRIDEDKYFIPAFSEFQYGELNPNNNAHRSVLKIIKKIEENEPLRSPSQGAQDKDKDKDKDQDKEKGGKTKRSKYDYPTGFEEIYDAYPRKEGKQDGFKIYQREIKSAEERASLLTAVKNYAARKSGIDVEFLKHFGTFMGEWRDWLDAKTGSATNRSTINTTPLKLEDIA